MVTHVEQVNSLLCKIADLGGVPRGAVKLIYLRKERLVLGYSRKGFEFTSEMSEIFEEMSGIFADNGWILYYFFSDVEVYL